MDDSKSFINFLTDGSDENVLLSSVSSVEIPPLKISGLQKEDQINLIGDPDKRTDKKVSKNNYRVTKEKFLSPLKPRKTIEKINVPPILEKPRPGAFEPELEAQIVPSACIDALNSTLTCDERKLDFQIQNLRRQISIARQAQKYQTSTADRVLQAQTEKWRLAGQMASNFLLNVAGIRVTRQGGLPEYLKRQRERKLRQIREYRDELPEFEDLFSKIDEIGGLNALSPDERAQFEDMRIEYEAAAEQRVRDMEAALLQEFGRAEEVPPELDMKHLYMLMKLDPKILYPTGFDNSIV